MPWSVERNGPLLRVTVEPPLGASRADLFDRVIGEVESGGVWTVELPASLEQGYVEDHATLEGRGTAASRPLTDSPHFVAIARRTVRILAGGPGRTLRLGLTLRRAPRTALALGTSGERERGRSSV